MGHYDVLKLRGVSEHSWMEKRQVLWTSKNVDAVGRVAEPGQRLNREVVCVVSHAEEFGLNPFGQLGEADSFISKVTELSFFKYFIVEIFNHV